MNDKLYKIKPLVWESLIQPYAECYTATTKFGGYQVRRYREDWDEDKPWCDWQFYYCFEEYNDEGEDVCESLEDGKAMAERDWIERLSQDLEEATPESS